MDRWHQLDDAIDASGLPASDRAVFRALLKRSDYVSADLPARFTPTRQELCRTTGLNLRQVNYSVRHLERHGWLAVSGAAGLGHKPECKLGAGAGCDCHGRVHTPGKGDLRRVQPDGLKGAVVAPFTVQPKGTTPQVTTGFALRGTERMGERVPEPEPVTPVPEDRTCEPEPADSAPGWPRHTGGRRLSFVEVMALHEPDPWR